MTPNLDMQVTGHTLTIKIDLSKTFGTSSSGKTRIVASTQGNQDVPGHPGLKIGLNLYKPL